MVLSRFWIAIFVSSIIFVFISFFTGNSYSVDYILNGQKDEPILISEKYLEQIPTWVKDSLATKKDNTFVINKVKSNPDTTYIFKNKTVKIYSGKQKSDGLLPTCKSSLFDIILPLIAYLAFFCGLMQLLKISQKAEPNF